MRTINGDFWRREVYAAKNQFARKIGGFPEVQCGTHLLGITVKSGSPPRPRKRFGQHFLHDKYVLQKIVAAINPRTEDALVEIGPGQGALTFPLLQRCGKLQAIEIDNDLAERLPKQAAEFGELQVHNADALRFDFAQLVDQPHSLRVVGNLPYNISTPLLFHLIKSIHSIQDMHFLLQKEVVDRLAATPENRKSYGRLSIMAQYYCHAEWLFDVGPGAFKPPPKVDSAVIRLTPRKQPEVAALDFQHFSSLVQHTFSQRRKTLRKSLKKMASDEHFSTAAIDSSLRPETLWINDFVNLSNTIIETTKHQG